jgi:hypothetical protein
MKLYINVFLLLKSIILVNKFKYNFLIVLWMQYF